MVRPMVSLADLWLPILLSAVFVFVVSSVIHMVLPVHKADYKKLAGEAEVLAAIRAQGIAPGQYMFPCPASMKDMGTPEMQAKFVQGPVGFVTIRPSGVPSIGKSLGQWFVYSIVIGVFVAYVATLALPPSSESMQVFRFTGAVAVLGYALGYVPDSIWKGLSWSITVKFVLDGVAYGLATATAFAWLWPGAVQ